MSTHNISSIKKLVTSETNVSEIKNRPKTSILHNVSKIKSQVVEPIKRSSTTTLIQYKSSPKVLAKKSQVGTVHKSTASNILISANNSQQVARKSNIPNVSVLNKDENTIKKIDIQNTQPDNIKIQNDILQEKIHTLPQEILSNYSPEDIANNNSESIIVKPPMCVEVLCIPENISDLTIPEKSVFYEPISRKILHNKDLLDQRTSQMTFEHNFILRDTSGDKVLNDTSGDKVLNDTSSQESHQFVIDINPSLQQENNKEMHNSFVESPNTDCLITNVATDQSFSLNDGAEIGSKLTKRSLVKISNGVGTIIKSITELWFENASEYRIPLGLSSSIEIIPPTTMVSSDYVFDMVSNGRLRYIGKELARVCKCSVSISLGLLKSNIRDENVIALEIRKNGCIVAGANYRQHLINDYRFQTISFHKLIKLSSYDVISVFITNLTSSRGISVYSFNLMVE
jgi:hypothetical protein